MSRIVDSFLPVSKLLTNLGVTFEWGLGDEANDYSAIRLLYNNSCYLNLLPPERSHTLKGARINSATDYFTLGCGNMGLQVDNIVYPTRRRPRSDCDLVLNTLLTMGKAVLVKEKSKSNKPRPAPWGAVHRTGLYSEDRTDMRVALTSVNVHNQTDLSMGMLVLCLSRVIRTSCADYSSLESPWWVMCGPSEAKRVLYPPTGCQWRLLRDTS